MNEPRSLTLGFVRREKHKILFAMGVLACMLVFRVETAHAQPVSLYTATQNAAAEFFSSLEHGTSIAIIAIEADPTIMSSYIINEMIIALVGVGTFIVADRNHLDLAVQRLHFQISMEANEATVRSVGRFMGVQTVVTGAFEPIGDSFHFRVQAIEVETANILAVYTTNVQSDRIITFLRGETSFYRPHDVVPISIPLIGREDPTRFWSVGFSVGTAVTEPLLIVSFQTTLAPLSNWFIRVGADMGFISNVEEASYYSISMFAHYSFFQPFSWGGWHIGAGGSFTIAEYRFEFIAVPRMILAADFVTGVNIGNRFDISYVLRTNFSTIFSNRVLVGFTYRFPSRSR